MKNKERIWCHVYDWNKKRISIWHLIFFTIFLLKKKSGVAFILRNYKMQNEIELKSFTVISFGSFGVFPHDRIFFCSEIHGIKLLEQVIFEDTDDCFTRSTNTHISLSLGVRWLIFKLLHPTWGNIDQVSYLKYSL